MLALLCWWSYLELTLNELLAPTEFLSITHNVYQQMHFGRTGALSGMTLLIVIIPILLVASALLFLHLAPKLLPRNERQPLENSPTEAQV